MTPDVVVDIGNSRMKWGRCENGRVAEMVSLPLNDSMEWSAQAEKWNVTGSTRWAVGGVNPQWIEVFLLWPIIVTSTRIHFTNFTQLPIRLNVDKPKNVGLDRLFGAIGANALRRVGCGAITVDIGTAVTLNVIDPDGVFRGGAIFPGFRLMAKALYDNTAKLPLVEVEPTNWQQFPGTDTSKSIAVGIRLAVEGGVKQACSELTDWFGPPEGIDAFVTGGSSTPNLLHLQGWKFQHVPSLNLEGIRIAAEALP